MTLLPEGEFYNYVTSPAFSQEEGAEFLETLREPDYIHYEDTTLSENTRFRNNLFAWLKQTRILAINRIYFDPYGAHSFITNEELGKGSPLLHPTMRFPSYYKHFPGFPTTTKGAEPHTTIQERQQLREEVIIKMNEVMQPQFLLRNPDQFIGQSIYQMLSSVAAYQQYKIILRDAIREIPTLERELRSQAEYTRISDSEPKFIARNQSNPNRHAGILEEYNIVDILDLLYFYLNDLPDGDDVYNKLVVSSEYLWTDVVTTRQIDPKHLHFDEYLFEELTGYDFTDHIDERFDDREEETQDYGDWIEGVREGFDWNDAISEYPVAASYTGLANLISNYYGPNAEINAEVRRVRGAPHAVHNQKITTRKHRINQLRYGFLYSGPDIVSWSSRPSVPEGNDRYNDVEQNTEYTSNSVMWTNYYLARDRYTYLIIDGEEDNLVTELSSTQGFTFSIPVNFLNFLRYPPTTLKKPYFRHKIGTLSTNTTQSHKKTHGS